MADDKIDLDFLKQEYQVINSEINRAITLQMSLLTATVSASILLLALFMSFVGNNSQNGTDLTNIDYLIFLLPLGVIIPSMWVFYEKTFYYSIKVAYAQIVESIVYGELIVQDYRGYRNTLHDYFRTAKQNEPEILQKKEINANTNIFISIYSNVILTLREIKNGIFNVFVPFKQIIMMDRNYRECRFWIYSFIAFLAIICICYTITFYLIVKKLFANNAPISSLLSYTTIVFLGLLIITVILLIMLMHGYIFEKNASYFRIISGPILITSFPVAMFMGFDRVQRNIHLDVIFEAVYFIIIMVLMVYMVILTVSTAISMKNKEYSKVNPQFIFQRLAVFYGIFLLMYIVKSNYYLGIGYGLFYLATFATIFTVIWAILTICSFAYGPNSIDNNYTKIKNLILEGPKEEQRTDV